jgi:hypothetical protein
LISYSNILVSFGDFCSNDLSCHNSLICSNSSQCVCPLSSFWNTNQNTCLSCPPGWIEWQNEKCLLFVKSFEGGIKYYTARNVCLTQFAQLLQIEDHEDFVQFEYKIDELIEGKHGDAFNEFVNKGVWINITDRKLEKH